MQQRTRRLAIIVGSTLLATAGFVLAACSTDNGTTTPLPGGGTGGKDSGSSSKDSGGNEEEEDDDSGTTSKDGGGADCGNAPKLRDNTDRFYCAFASDGGYCANNETCCNSGKNAAGDFPPGFCATAPTKGGTNGQTVCNAQAASKGSEWFATGSSTWECGDNSACGSGKTCCMFTAPDAGGTVNIGPLNDTKIHKDCKAQQAYKQGGTRCATSCAADEIEMCSKTDECGTGTCSPMQALFRDLAYCK